MLHKPTTITILMKYVELRIFIG